MTEHRDAITNARQWAVLADEYLTAARDQRTAAGGLAGTPRAARRRTQLVDYAVRLADHAADARAQSLMWATIAPLLSDESCGEVLAAADSLTGRSQVCIRTRNHASAYHRDADDTMWRPVDETDTTARQECQ